GGGERGHEPVRSIEHRVGGEGTKEDEEGGGEVDCTSARCGGRDHDPARPTVQPAARLRAHVGATRRARPREGETQRQRRARGEGVQQQQKQQECAVAGRAPERASRTEPGPLAGRAGAPQRLGGKRTTCVEPLLAQGPCAAGWWRGAGGTHCGAQEAGFQHILASWLCTEGGGVARPRRKSGLHASRDSLARLSGPAPAGKAAEGGDTMQVNLPGSTRNPTPAATPNAPTNRSSKCEVERRRAQHGSTAWSAATLCMASSHVSMPASTQRCHRLWLSPRGSRTAPAASSPAQTEDVHDGPAQVREEHPEQPREHDLHERARGDEEEVGRGHEPEQPAGGETFARSESGAEDQLATAAITQISASPTPRRYTLRAAGMHLNPRAMPTASEAPRSSTTPPRSNRSSRSRRPRRRSGGYGRRQTRTGSSP
ncbi:unnamed protein product, partial [Prorocentrum cordatum]